jgi:hypothetical protein
MDQWQNDRLIKGFVTKSYLRIKSIFDELKMCLFSFLVASAPSSFQKTSLNPVRSWELALLNTRHPEASSTVSIVRLLTTLWWFGGQSIETIQQVN